jgi:hypothetical protein
VSSLFKGTLTLSGTITLPTGTGAGKEIQLGAFQEDGDDSGTIGAGDLEGPAQPASSSDGRRPRTQNILLADITLGHLA